jgi:hypothetical protein
MNLPANDVHSRFDDIAATLKAILDKPSGPSAPELRKLAAELLGEIENNRLDIAGSLHAALKDLRVAAQFEAARTSSKWLYENADKVTLYGRRPELLDAVLRSVPASGDFLEFGVFTGAVTWFVRPRFPDRTYHAFDSFLGVPEAMSLAVGRSAFNLGGEVPKLPPNTTVHAGWFKDTIPDWRGNFKSSAAFAYIDCDLYESVQVVLQGLTDRVREGTILVFDDWYNFPNWQQHSLRAFNEWIDATRIKIEPIGFTTKEHSGAFKVVG